MYRLTYGISKKREKALSRMLKKSGISDYYFENSGRKNFLHVFSMSPQPPAAINSYTPDTVTEVDELSWRHSWADAFKGHELTDEIYILPEGPAAPPEKYKYIIRIDPRDSFGDGHHPTTRLCAMLLQEHLALQERPEGLSMMDIGTGSGVLAVEAFLYGVKNIELFDIDEGAVNMAVKNLDLNGVKGVVPFRGDIYNYTFTRRYDIITANLLTGLIEDNIASIAEALGAGGVLIISGISAKWTRLAKRIFTQNNLIIHCHKKLEGWNGFLLKKQCHSKQ